jgi:hypothetical protein
LYGFTEANLKELQLMVSIYQPFMKGEIWIYTWYL